MKNTIEADIPAAKSCPSICLPYFVEEPVTNNNTNFHRDLINIGTLETRKNQSFLLHVLASAKRKGFSYSLSLVGDGPDRRKLENLSRQLKIENQVTFLGYQKNAARFLHNHSVYVHSALMDNLPVALHEALAYNLPICAGPVGGIPEIFMNEKEGFYWPLEDPNSAADLLIRLMENVNTYQQMAIASKLRRCKTSSFSNGFLIFFAFILTKTLEDG
jgi:glycosyltransferase involved in cell wall biosynthesis